MGKTSLLKKYLMWNKVNELFSDGLNKSQIGLSLGLHRQTVSKYLSMTEDEFMSSQSYDRHYGHKLDSYESYLVNELYSHETGKTLATHRISGDKGCLISNTSHRRDREASLNDYEASVRKELPDSAVIDEYLSQLRVHKARNYRDNLQFIARRYGTYPDTVLTEAFTKCLRRASSMDVA